MQFALSLSPHTVPRAGLPNLKTLTITNNKLESRDDIEHLSACTSLQTLDLSNNKIEGEDALDVVKSLTWLSYLRMTGNPVVSNTRNYRKTMLATMLDLKYLDDSPCFEKVRETGSEFVCKILISLVNFWSWWWGRGQEDSFILAIYTPYMNIVSFIFSIVRLPTKPFPPIPAIFFTPRTVAVPSPSWRAGSRQSVPCVRPFV